MTINIQNSRIPFSREDGWRDILVIGGGASGVLFAANLLRRHADLRVTVIEGRHLLGCGIAYSTTDPDHLLNTRVHNMSAFPDDEPHFLRWLQARNDGITYDRDSFVSRAIYGSYLSCLLAPWQQSGRLLCLRANCIEVSERKDGVKITLDDDSVLTGAYAVLATGHVVPTPDANGLVVGAWEQVRPAVSDTVMIIGTGLSMVDQVLSLRRGGHTGKIIAISRRGLLPHPHQNGTPIELTRTDLPLGVPLSQFLKWFREKARWAEARGGTWRDALDAVRPWVSVIWQEMSIEQRGRFLRHCAAWWEVHRHRIPPASKERLQRAVSMGRLQISRAQFLRAERHPDGGIDAIIRYRGTSDEASLSVDHIIDCRGIRNDPVRNATPLVAGLLNSGSARIDPLRIGLDVAETGQVINAHGEICERLFALGPVSRSKFWEITAIPDIRVQARQMAMFIAAQSVH